MKRWLVPSFLIHTCLWKSHSNGIIFCHISQHEELTLEDTIIAFSHTDQNKTRQDHLTDQCLLLCWYNGIQGSLQGIYCKRVFLSFCQHIFNDVTGHKQNSIIRALSVTLVVNVEKMEKAPKYIFNDRKGTSWRCRPASSRRCLRRRKRQRSWSSVLSSTLTSSSLDCYIFCTPGVKLVCFWVNQEEWSPGNNYKNSDKTQYTTKNM